MPVPRENNPLLPCLKVCNPTIPTWIIWGLFSFNFQTKHLPFFFHVEKEVKQPTSQRTLLLAVLFITYFMDVKLIDSAPWASPRRGKHTFDWPRHSIHYLLYGCETLLIVHPEQVPDEEDPPGDWLKTFLTRSIYYLLYGFEIYIDSAPWAGPRLRRPTLRLADNFFLPFYLLLTLWMC